LAEQGDAEAEYNIGALYATGRGVPQNFKEAVSWYLKAANQGVAEAQQELAYMYLSGYGTSQNFFFAYLWSSLAAAQGITLAEHTRDVAAARLGSDQISYAQELTQRWRPGQPILPPPSPEAGKLICDTLPDLLASASPSQRAGLAELGKQSGCNQ
jgi:TPR repeat protein